MDNREIKFRAWIPESKQMLDVEEIIWEDYKIWRIQFRAAPNKGYYLEQADEYILMQFTGLYDTTGSPIYEGDILSCWRKRIGKKRIWGVIYSTEHACFGLKNNNNDVMGGFALYDTYEVIGNIHQNPELLNNCNH